MELRGPETIDMDTFTTPGLIGLTSTDTAGRNGHKAGPQESKGQQRRPSAPPGPPPSIEVLRRVAWEVGERKAGEKYCPSVSHVGLAMATPSQGFAHWRIQPAWIEEMARKRGDAWHNCRTILRLYDVSYVIFNGFNANQVNDHTLPAICGHMFFKAPRPGTWQLAEVGFLLRSGEFIPVARSKTVHFSNDAVSPRSDHAALLVSDRFGVEEVGNVWEQEKILSERRKPKLRSPLRIATFAFESLVSGQEGLPARFVSELAAGQVGQGHEVHVFVPAARHFASDRTVGDVHYHTLEIPRGGTPVDAALGYARAAETRLQDFPVFDLLHLCEWMTGLAPWIGTKPTVLSLSSIEATRRNGCLPSALSLEIQRAERELAHSVDCILAPDWLREKAVADFGIDGARVHPFPMEARVLDEWECPLDYGQVKIEIGLGPLDRLLLFVGPLEYDAGVDLLIEALPVALSRVSNARLVLVGTGGIQGALQHRANQLGLGHAVRFLGHMAAAPLARIVRAAETLILPARRRVYQDDAVVDLARRAGRPVVTTHGGPAYLVKHEETGLVTYDNPGSIVWAMDRILGDPGHAECMGRNGKRGEAAIVSWSEAARRFLELCAANFPELRTAED